MWLGRAAHEQRQLYPASIVLAMALHQLKHDMSAHVKWLLNRQHDEILLFHKNVDGRVQAEFILFCPGIAVIRRVQVITDLLVEACVNITEADT